MNRDRVLLAFQTSLNAVVNGKYVLSEETRIETLRDEAGLDSIDEIELHMTLEDELQRDIDDGISVDMFRQDTVGEAITVLLNHIGS